MEEDRRPTLYQKSFPDQKQQRLGVGEGTQSQEWEDLFDAHSRSAPVTWAGPHVSSLGSSTGWPAAHWASQVSTPGRSLCHQEKLLKVFLEEEEMDSTSRATPWRFSWPPSWPKPPNTFMFSDSWLFPWLRLSLLVSKHSQGLPAPGSGSPFLPFPV
jgi:hypothetical protein